MKIIETQKYIDSIALPTIRHLEETVHEISSILPDLEFIDDSLYQRFRYKEPDARHVCLLMAVRVVSSLNASICLWASGHVQEMGVIARTTYEFLNNIMFMTETPFGEPLPTQQQRFLEDFLKEEVSDPARPFDNPVVRETVPRSKIVASIARTLTAINPHDQSKMLSQLENVFSGYVHGAYPHVMELCGGDPPCFHMTGLLDTPKIPEWQKSLNEQLHRATVVIGCLCHHFGMHDRFIELKRVRDGFEEAVDFKFTLTPKQMLQKIKKGRAGHDVPHQE